MNGAEGIPGRVDGVVGGIARLQGAQGALHIKILAIHIVELDRGDHHVVESGAEIGLLGFRPPFGFECCQLFGPRVFGV